MFSRQKNSFVNENGKASKVSLKLMEPHFYDMLEITGKYGKLLKQEPFEKLNISSKFGYNLVAKLYRSSNWNGITIICVHGYQSSGDQDYAHTGYKFLKEGYNVLLVDNCACGESGGDLITFGIRESQDTALWVSKINELFPTGKIVLIGQSLGGATVCMMSTMNLSNVSCIIADCPFVDMMTEFCDMFKLFTGFKFKGLIKHIEKYTIKKAGFDFTSESPLESVKKAKYPILFIHGKEDAFIPVKSQTTLFNACTSKKEKITFDDAGHCGSQFKPNYFNNVYKFIKENI